MCQVEHGDVIMFLDTNEKQDTNENYTSPTNLKAMFQKTHALEAKVEVYSGAIVVLDHINMKKIGMNSLHQIHWDPSALKDENEILQTMYQAAYNDAIVVLDHTDTKKIGMHSPQQIH